MTLKLLCTCDTYETYDRCFYVDKNEYRTHAIKGCSRIVAAPLNPKKTEGGRNQEAACLKPLPVQ